MLRVPISSIERLLSEINKEVENKFMSAPIESLLTTKTKEIYYASYNY